MITSVYMKCVKCGKVEDIKSYDSIHPWKIARKEFGWIQRGKNWYCKKCKLERNKPVTKKFNRTK
jgi:hypothetical protein